MELRKLMLRLSKKFPLSLAESWDFSGYQMGDKSKDKKIEKVLLCLDFTEEVYAYALKENPDLILSHHPFFFGKKKEVLETDLLKKKLFDSYEKELFAPLYSFHTNYDNARDGMNDSILKILGYENITTDDDGMLRFALLPKEMTVNELALELKEKLHQKYVFYNDNGTKTVTKIAMIAGGGSEFYKEAMEKGADCYISGDCPHHTRLDIKRNHYNYIDISHEIEEQGFVYGMAKALKSIDESLNVIPYLFEEDFSIV